MLKLYISEKYFRRRNDINLAKGASIVLSDRLVREQLQVLRGDCNWELQEQDKAIAKLKAGECDGIVLQGLEDLDISYDLKPIEVTPDLVLTKNPDYEIRFLHSDLSSEIQNQIIDLEDKLKATVRSEFPKAELAVHVEIGEEEDGHKKNLLKLAFLDSGMNSPYLLRFSSGDKEKLLTRALEKLNGIQARKVFITRDLNEKYGLKMALESNGFTLSGKSLIEHRIILFSKTPEKRLDLFF